MQKKNIELIRKLQALADRGVGGEKETAQKKLTLLIEKYGISESELDESKIKEHRIKYRGRYEKKLLVQVIYARGLRDEIYVPVCGKGMKSEFILKSTDSEAMQIRIEFDFYRQLFEEETDFLYECFLNKHGIFPPNTKCVSIDRAAAEMMLSMMSALKDRNFTERIEMQ